MITDFCLDDILEEMAKASSLSDMRELLIRIRDEYGLTNIVYHAAKLPGWADPHPLILLSYHPEWLRRYVSENYFIIDPVHKHATTSFLPLDWSTIDRSRSDVSEFFKDAERHEVGRHGMTIPVRGPNGERSLFTVTSNLSTDEWERRRTQIMRDYHALAHFFHNRAALLVGARGDAPRLSNREVQVIKLLADGLPPKVIAFTLGISESAVRLFTSSAKHKLKCATLAQTIATATRHEII